MTIALLLLTAGAASADPTATLQVAYPVPHALVQRETATEGVLHVRGRYPADAKPGGIEARFCGRQWQVLDAAPKDGAFTGSLREAVGQGDLEVHTHPRVVQTIIEQAPKLLSRWEKAIFGKPIDCHDFLEGFATAAQRLVAGQRPVRQRHR